MQNKKDSRISLLTGVFTIESFPPDTKVINFVVISHGDPITHQEKVCRWQFKKKYEISALRGRPFKNYIKKQRNLITTPL